MSRRPRLYSPEGREAFKTWTGVDLPPEPVRDPVLLQKLIDGALLTDAQLRALDEIVERTRLVLTAGEHRVLASYVKRGIEAPKQLRAVAKASEPGRDAALDKRDRENRVLIGAVENYVRRHRVSMSKACERIAPRYGIDGPSLERRYRRAKKSLGQSI